MLVVIDGVLQPLILSVDTVVNDFSLHSLHFCMSWCIPQLLNFFDCLEEFKILEYMQSIGWMELCVG